MELQSSAVEYIIFSEDISSVNNFSKATFWARNE